MQTCGEGMGAPGRLLGRQRSDGKASLDQAFDPDANARYAARFLTAYYFIFLLIILPLLGLFETTKPLPNSILESVLHEGVPIGASAPPPSDAKV